MEKIEAIAIRNFLILVVNYIPIIIKPFMNADAKRGIFCQHNKYIEIFLEIPHDGE